MLRHGDLEPHYCPVCGAEFYPADDWGYAYGAKQVCSYHCMRSLDIKNRRTLTEKDSDAKRRKAWEMHEAGKSWGEIAERLGYYDRKSAASAAYVYRKEALEREAAEIAAYEAEAVG